MSQFEALLQGVRREYGLEQERRLNQRERLRAMGAGGTFTLALEERLLSTLLYFRLHLTGALLSCLFDVDESTLWRERTQRMQPVLRRVLPLPMQDHLLSVLEASGSGSSGSGSSGSGSSGSGSSGSGSSGSGSSGSGSSGSGTKKSPPRIGTLKELLEQHPELRDLVVDATEQQRPRPSRKSAKGKLDHKRFYSGKSHCHTLKTQVTTAKRLILHLAGNCPGSVHDLQLLRASGGVRAVAAATTPLKTQVKKKRRPARQGARHRRRVRMDKGYAGVNKDYGTLPGVCLLAARKGGGRKKLSLFDQMWNRVVVSPQRMQVEQNIGHLQNFRVLSGLYRARPHTHQDTFALVAGLHNFTQLGQLSWSKP